jgi:hypothetical protein
VDDVFPPPRGEDPPPALVRSTRWTPTYQHP